MGVMACDRNNCENTMCETYIEDFYICNECKAEFKVYALSDGSEFTQQRRELIAKFEFFMQTKKICGSNDDVHIDDFLTGK